MMVKAMGQALLQSDTAADQAVSALAGYPRTKMGRLIEDAVAGKQKNLPTELVHMVEQAASFPIWADLHRLEKAGELLFRSAVPGGIVLGAKSLLSGYTSPAGNKPLIWTGALRSNVSWRLAETARFVQAVAEPNGLLPGRPGFQISLKVRLMHAQVRHLIGEKGGWPTARWGVPINQHDMVGTILLFSNAWLDGIEALGVHATDEEAENYIHLWRVAGHILGVDHDLLYATRAEGDRLASFVQLTQEPPDDDSRSLVQAFLEHPVQNATTARAKRAAERQMQAYAGFVRGLLGEEMADQLGLQKDPWRFAVPAAREIVRRLERIRRSVPGGQKKAIELGREHWSRVVRLGLQGMTPKFALPEGLA